jgi:hypothetical protein
MNMWRVGEDMGSKETDGCPLTVIAYLLRKKVSLSAIMFSSTLLMHSNSWMSQYACHESDIPLFFFYSLTTSHDSCTHGHRTDQAKSLSFCTEP